jgi:hypothetical protein
VARRFDPSYIALHDAVARGDIGTPVHIRVMFGDHPIPQIDFLKSGQSPTWPSLSWQSKPNDCSLFACCLLASGFWFRLLLKRRSNAATAHGTLFAPSKNTTTWLCRSPLHPTMPHASSSEAAVPRATSQRHAVLLAPASCGEVRFSEATLSDNNF